MSAVDNFVHRPSVFVGVIDPRTVHVGVASRDDFDKIAVPVVDHGQTETGHVLTKAVESSDGVRVVFQYWLNAVSGERYLEIARRKRLAGGEG